VHGAWDKGGGGGGMGRHDAENVALRLKARDEERVNWRVGESAKLVLLWGSATVEVSTKSRKLQSRKANH